MQYNSSTMNINKEDTIKDNIYIKDLLMKVADIKDYLLDNNRLEAYRTLMSLEQDLLILNSPDYLVERWDL